ncbi:hypothetical protein [Roseisolibacter sp. H3M3-2]|uniref:hypothetical protein n=1 Tax=Roseisolibacter sp. H3M3-2 TaxID=3031323 RepID=UPI0023D9E98A|nr:hypothetical protein [Roseisolibacter sp. H3M3-2]MDF1501722.1 hypothetical protein [Roseisolibacter sp. H3M3-2]
MRWGVRGGLGVAGTYALVATVMRVAGGTRAFERQGVSYPAAVISYVVLGAVAGAAIGLCRPALRHGLGRAVVSLGVGLMVATGITLVASGHPSRWDVDEYGAIILVALGVSVVLAREFRQAATASRAS